MKAGCGPLAVAQFWMICWGEGMVRYGLQRESSFRYCLSQKSGVEPQQMPVLASPVVLSRACDRTTGCCEEEPFTPSL